MQYQIRQIFAFDKAAQQQVLALLTGEGITRDRNLDYTAAIFDESGVMAATGSFFRNTLRCLAVRSDLRGEGLLGTLVSHLVDELAQRGVFDVFLYTKYQAARYFKELGFHTLAEVDRQVVFMENSATAFQNYLDTLKTGMVAGKKAAAIVMNANPFTLGHQYLAEQASANCDLLHLFIVREDISAFPFSVRERLVRAGTQHLKNIVYHDTGSYLVSSATFPSYFIQDSREVTVAQARVDAAVFGKIARALDIGLRFVGDEPFSFATNLYNETMAEDLPKQGVELRIIPRKLDAGSQPISATRVRRLLAEGDTEGLRALLPETTLAYLLSPEGQEVARRIPAQK